VHPILSIGNICDISKMVKDIQKKRSRFVEREVELNKNKLCSLHPRLSKGNIFVTSDNSKGIKLKFSRHVRGMVD